MVDIVYESDRRLEMRRRPVKLDSSSDIKLSALAAEAEEANAAGMRGSGLPRALNGNRHERECRAYW